MLETWIGFGQGPLFRLCLALMLLGLTRIFLLTIIGMIEALRRNEDKIIPWKDLIGKTISWLFPLKRLFNKRPVYSLISLIFHIGLIIVPLFLAAHLLLWKNVTGFAVSAIPKLFADNLTLTVIICSILLFLMRLFYQPARAISRKQDYLWPILLIIPFLPGYICSNGSISPNAYLLLMLIHVYSANLIMVMIPFTKIAHCVLMPFSQLVTAIGWKFPKGAGGRVIETLGLKNRPTWVEKPRLVYEDLTPEKEEVSV